MIWLISPSRTSRPPVEALKSRGRAPGIWDRPLKAEAVEQRLFITRRSPIIDRIYCTQQKRISARRPDQAEFFNAICAF